MMYPVPCDKCGKPAAWSSAPYDPATRPPILASVLCWDCHRRASIALVPTPTAHETAHGGQHAQ